METITHCCVSPDGGDIEGASGRVAELLKKLISQGEKLVPKVEDVKAEQMGDLIEHEMQDTANAIEAAASRIAVCTLVFYTSI